MLFSLMQNLQSEWCPKIATNGSRFGEVVDFGKLSLKFITNVKKNYK